MMSDISKLNLRLASDKDLDILLHLEQVGFQGDRFSEDIIEYQLTRAHATIFIAEIDDKPTGAAYMLWRQALQIGRLYNIVIDPAYQGKGIGGKLLKECELEAARRGCRNVLLEVRTDNENAIRFYEKKNYRITRTLNAYYEDGQAGYKMTKELSLKVDNSLRLSVPYYYQSFDFSCGSACLLMAMKCLDPQKTINRLQEITIWREATLVFMTSGIGGTGPYGLALAAVDRKYRARLMVSTDKPPFLKTVRSADKKEVIRLVHEDMQDQAEELGIAVRVVAFTLEDILSMIYRGWVPIVLISTYRLTGDRVPHWVVVTGFDEQNIYIHDPDADSYRPKIARAKNIPILKKEFLKMSRYGTESYRSVIFIGYPEK